MSRNGIWKYVFLFVNEGVPSGEFIISTGIMNYYHGKNIASLRESERYRMTASKGTGEDVRNALIYIYIGSNRVA